MAAISDVSKTSLEDKVMNGNHPIFSKDPSSWLELLHRRVSISTIDGNIHRGWVYTIDPVSESIVLINHPEDDFANCAKVSIDLIIGSSVTKVEQSSCEMSKQVEELCNRLFRPNTNICLSQEEILLRRETLKSWLQKHRLPVKLGGPDGKSLVVADALFIQPPFTEDSCLSTNEIILSKIQGLIKNMPIDQSTW